MRTIFAASLAVLLILSFWAAANRPKPPPPGRIVLTWVTDNNPARQEQMRLFRDFCRRKGHPEVDIRLDPDNGGMDKIVVQSVGGIGPDLFDMYQADQLNAFADTGILLDVTEIAKKRGFGLEAMWPALARACSVDGRQLAVPTNCSPSAIFYNKDVFDRYGVPYPKGEWTWEEFVRTAQRLTHKRPDGRGYESFGLMGLTLDECIWQAGGQYYGANGTRCILDAPEAIEGARFYTDMQHRYHVMPTAAEENAMSSSGGWGTGALNYFMGGHIAMIVSGRFAVINWRKVPDLRVGVAPLPHQKIHANRLFWRCTGVNANSPNRDAALLFLEFLATEAYSRDINTSGDGISAIPGYTRREEFLRDTAHPEETDNALWVQQMRTTRDIDISPYANPFVVTRIITGHTELMRSGDESPETAMRRAAREINDKIARNIARDPLMRDRYRRETSAARTAVPTPSR